MRLRFWVKQGLDSLLMALGASALYILLMSIQTDDGLAGMLVLAPLYLLVFGGFMTMAFVIGIYKLSVPLALSFGSTRNEVLLGLQIMRLFPIVGIPALAALLTAVSGDPASMPAATLFPMGIGFITIMSALGSVFGVVYTKFGKIATVATVISIALGGMAGGVFAALAGDSNPMDWLARQDRLGLLVLCIGLFVYSLAMIPEHRTVWKCNVKL